MRIEGTGEACKEGGDDKGQHAVAEGLHADGFGEFVLPVNGVEGEPDARALDAVKDEERNRDDDEAEIVVIDRIVEIDPKRLDIGKGRNELDALGAAEQPG